MLRVLIAEYPANPGRFRDFARNDTKETADINAQSTAEQGDSATSRGMTPIEIVHP